jgi:hypothetical protein
MRRPGIHLGGRGNRRYGLVTDHWLVEFCVRVRCELERHLGDAPFVHILLRGRRQFVGSGSTGVRSLRTDAPRACNLPRVGSASLCPRRIGRRGQLIRVES